MAVTDFSRFAETKHMLEWLAEDATSVMVTDIEAMLNEQVAGSKIERFVMTSDPVWLSGGLPSDDGASMTLTRTAVVFEFELDVTSEQTFTLVGAFTWAAAGLNQPGGGTHRTWFDINGTLAEFGADGLLAERIYFAEQNDHVDPDKNGKL